jgi:hypothetical protein
MPIQPAKVFINSLNDATKQLAKWGLPDERWDTLIQQAVASLLEKAKSPKEPPATYLKPMPELAPENKKLDKVASQFDLDEISQSIEQLLTTTKLGAVLTKSQTQALGLEIQWLLDCKRYHGRRKGRRAIRIVNAAHRRAILACDVGPLRANLERSVEDLLSKS